MAEEIRFFGFGNNFSTPNVRQELDSIGIAIPASCLMTRDEVSRCNPSEFSWPLLVGVPNKIPSKSVPSWEELQEVLDEVRDPASKISFQLPIVGSPNTIKKNTYIYLGKDFICIYNAESDLGLTLNTDNSSLYHGVSSDTVFRLVYGYQGLVLDTVYSGEDFSAITANKMYHLNNPDIFDSFREGYVAGFCMDNSDVSILKNLSFSIDSYIGDAKVFGLLVGSLFRRRLLKAINMSDLEKMDSLSIAYNIFIQGADVSSKVESLITAHNGIINSPFDVTNLVEVLNRLCDKQSAFKFSALQTWDLANKAQALSEDISSMSSFAPDPNRNLAIKNILGGAKIEPKLSYEKAQYRILSTEYGSFKIRLQLQSPEIVNQVYCDGEVSSVVSWKKHGLWETDFDIGTKSITDKNWSDWYGLITSAKFNEASLYHGSNSKYARLQPVENAFALEDGSVFITNHYFFTVLNKNHSVKIAGV